VNSPAIRFVFAGHDADDKAIAGNRADLPDGVRDSAPTMAFARHAG
jgi:hypothetical protein